MDALKKLVLTKLMEQALDKDGKPLVVDGQSVTNIEALIIGSIHSKDWRRIEYVLNVAYGKVPDIVAGIGDKGEVIIKVVHDDK
jgi:hypothetical protein